MKEIEEGGQNKINNFRFMRYAICFLLINFLSGCLVNKYLNKDFDGVYSSKNGRKLIFNNKSFVYVDNTYSGDLGKPCCDTLAIGYWSIDKDLIILNSPPWLNTYFIDFETKEKINNNRDSIYFEISAPIETQYKKYNQEDVALKYNITVQPEHGSVDYFKENNQHFNTTSFRFYNPNLLSIHSFNITIHPGASLKFRTPQVQELITPEYLVKDMRSNIFEIIIPRLDYGYLNYRRLKDEYVKVKDKHTLIWDGQYFIK